MMLVGGDMAFRSGLPQEHDQKISDQPNTKTDAKTPEKKWHTDLSPQKLPRALHGCKAHSTFGKNIDLLTYQCGAQHIFAQNLTAEPIGENTKRDNCGRVGQQDEKYGHEDVAPKKNIERHGHGNLKTKEWVGRCQRADEPTPSQ